MSTSSYRSTPEGLPKISSELRTLFLDQMDRRADKDHGSERRAHERFSHRADEGVSVVYTSPDGVTLSCLVHPRNLSAGGIAFLHEAFVPPESQCTIILGTPRGLLLTVLGRVVACRHVHGALHEIGVAFDAPIDLRALDLAGEYATCTTNDE